jgi:hypothetical protein
MKEISLHWCPTKEMVSDFCTKPLQGSHFKKLKDYIMGRVRYVKPKADAASIGKVAKKKVARVSGLRRSTMGGIKGCTRVCWHNSFMTIMPQECVGVYIVMVCMDRPYLTWTDLC